MKQQTQLPASDKSSRSKRQAVGLVAIIVILTCAFGLTTYKQYLIDQYVVWTFQPTSSLQEAATRAGLNDTGKFYLYASQASIVERAQFNTLCSSGRSEQTVVLGCYTTPAGRIYIYDIRNAQLDGIVEATTAHEMLHAAFDRLTSTDKTRVTKLLQAEAQKITDPRLLSLIRFYEKSEPSQLINELHSIIGTEVRSISPELDAYYRRYFADRVAVVTLTAQYQHVFAELEARQSQLVAELNATAASITSRQEAYNDTLETLNSDIKSFNNLAQSGQMTMDVYTSRRSALEARTTRLEETRTSLNTDITTYESKKKELDALNLRVQELNQSINSNVPEAPRI